jgi:hypothetical protein
MSTAFPLYTEYDPRVPVHYVTPDVARPLHRFFDTSPFSPSGRYLAITDLPFEDREPRPGDVARVVVVDLQDGTTRAVADTRGWDSQLGAQVQWGETDEAIYFNDLDLRTWEPFGVRLNLTSNKKERLSGTIYMVSNNGRFALSPCLKRTRITQAGYGVVVPPANIPEYDIHEDGIFITDLASGQTRLLVSIADILERAQPSLDCDRVRDGQFFGFHVKWNARDDRIMFALRWMPHEAIKAARKAMRYQTPTFKRGQRLLRKVMRWSRVAGHPARQNYPARLNYLITCDTKGKNLRVVVDADLWARGGHHPNWCPDGDHILMNLNLNGSGMRFVQMKYDGSDLRIVAPNCQGSGHPTMHFDGIHILTDAYPAEPVSFGDGTVPIRWIDTRADSELALLRIESVPRYEGRKRILRVDPHPAWDRSFTRFAFNACPGKRRGVFVADLGSAG